MGRRPKVSRKPLSKVDRPRIKREKDTLIRYNAELVEELIESEVYRDILKPLIDEAVASVEGKQIEGKWFLGDFNRSDNPDRLQFLRGYSLALKEFNNRLLSFIEAKHELQRKKEEEKAEVRQPLVNPFLEELKEMNDVGM